MRKRRGRQKDKEQHRKRDIEIVRRKDLSS